MFDIGFLELAVILVLSLLVLGPERLPKAAKTIGYWFGKARRYVEGMKAQVESEFDTTEVKRLLRNQEVQIRELQGKLQDTGNISADEYVNQLIDDDDPGNGHHNVDYDDDDPGEHHDVDYDDDMEKLSNDDKPSSPKYEMIEEDDERWDELEDSNPANLDKVEENQFEETSEEKVTDVVETKKAQSE